MTSHATRSDGRGPRLLRPIEMTLGFHRLAEGSVLYRAGGTVLLVTASVDDFVPDFMKGSGRGWVTAEYQMHPRANPKRRETREGRGRALSGRTQEIQRLIGRSLRAALDLTALGERTVVVDCDVLEADGGTRTAAITGGFVALVLAIAKIDPSGALLRRSLRDPVAAVSVGHVDGERMLDLCYSEDSSARMDMNVVATVSGALVEVQATAEAEPVARSEVDAMVDLALHGIAELCSAQADTLASVGVDIRRRGQD